MTKRYFMKILVTTGGSGGHMFPAIQTALMLRAAGHEIIFAGALAAGEEKIRTEGFVCHRIDAKGLTGRTPLGLAAWVMATNKAVGRARHLVRDIRPDKVLAFGGYGSFPVAAAAWQAGVPLMIHEQNVVPGKANRVMALMAKRIAVSFAASKKYFNASKTVWTGCPCHQHIPPAGKRELRLKFGLDPAMPVILILGGSQGSQNLNALVFGTLMSLGTKIQAIHMTGAKEYPMYAAKYRGSGLRVKVFAFLSPIEEAYAAAEVAIARAGAATVCELAAFALPSILVPYPFAGGHQKYNAALLSDTGAAVVMPEKDCTSARLKQAVEAMLAKPPGPDVMRGRIKDIFISDPAMRLAKALEDL